MSGLLEAAGWWMFALSLLGVIYNVAAALAVGWFLKRPPVLAQTFPPVTILKPLHGDEPGLRQCLDGFCSQDYPGPVQIVFGVRDASDPAIRVVRDLIRDNPALAIDLIIDPTVWGANLKLSNLINMQKAARHPHIVLADSDVSVGPDYLRHLVGALADPKIGFATCAFFGAPTGNGWSKLAAMAINHHFLPSVALGLRVKLATPCFGPTVAFRREVFEQAGGFVRFKDQLADDFEIGRAIRALGYGFAVPPMLIGHGCPEDSGRAMFGHELRWARTIQLVAPLSYLGSVVCHPMLFAMLTCLLQQGAAQGWMLLILVIASRLFILGEVTRLLAVDASLWWMTPLRDLLSAAVYCGAFAVRRVGWRGRRFNIGPGGVLTPCGRRPAYDLAGHGHGLETPSAPAGLSPGHASAA